MYLATNSSSTHRQGSSNPSGWSPWRRLVAPGVLLVVLLNLTGCATLPGVDDQAPPRSHLNLDLTFGSFESRLAVAQTVDRDLQDVAQRLVEEWLARFTRPDVHRRYKLKDYEVHSVTVRELDKGLWEVRTTFSVQPVKSSLNQSAWLAGNGHYERGWIQRKTLFMHMRLDEEEVVLSCGGTGP